MGAFDPGTNSFDQLAISNPQFANGAPGLAYDAFTAQDPSAAVPALAQAASGTSASDAINQHSKDSNGFSLWSWLSNGIHDVAALPGVSTALDYLNKPLQEVEKDYRFVHSVYTRHGLIPGLLVTAGIVGAGAAGAFAGPEASILAAELAASGARRVLGDSAYADSNADAENPNYQVSFGRDVANALSHIPTMGELSHTNVGLGKYLSGGLDAVAQLSADPVIVAGKIPSLVRGGQYLEAAKPIYATSASAGLSGTHPLLRYQPIQQFLASKSLRALTPEGIDAVRYGAAVFDGSTVPLKNGYNAALEDIAKSDAGTITRNYPPLRGLAPDLEKLDSADAVHQYLRTAYTAVDRDSLIYGPAVLPTRTLLRPLADKLRAGAWNVKTTDALGNLIPDRANALDQRGMLANQRNILFPRRTQQVQRDADGKIVPVGEPGWIAPAVLPQSDWGAALGGAIAKKVRTFTGYGAYSISSQLNNLSGKQFDLLNPEALEGIRRNINYAMGDKEATRLTGEMAEMQKAGHVSDLRAKWHAIQVDIIKAAGIPADNDMVEKVLARARQASDTPSGLSYSNDHMGVDHSAVLTDNGLRKLAVDEDQTNTMASFIDFRSLKGAMRDLNTVTKVYGKADDFYSSHIINEFFKPLALMTLGFAVRVASAEAIPAMMRYGGVKMMKARVAGTAGKMGVRLLPGEDEHAAVQSLLGLPGVDAHEALLSKLTPDDIRRTIDTAQQGSAWGVAKTRIRAAVGPGMVKWAGNVDPLALDTAIRAALKRGSVGNEITDAGHLTDYDVQGRAEQAVNLTAQKMGAAHAAARLKAGHQDAIKDWTEGDRYGLWQPGDEQFKLHWTLELQKMSQQLAHQQIAQDVLTHLAVNPDDVEGAWREATQRESARIAGKQYDPTKPDFMGAPLAKADDLRAPGKRTLERARIVRPDGTVGQDPYEWATDRVMRQRGAVTGMNGTLHDEFVQQIARGEKPDLDRVQEMSPEVSPGTIAGKEFVQIPPKRLLNRIVQGGFKKVIDPVIDSLSRQPLYVAAVTRERRSLAHAVQSGALSEDDAFNIAELRATHAILPQIHNTALRTQFAIMSNSYLPFYFAQEQAIKRALHLIHDTRGVALRQYQLVYEGITNPAFVNDDGQGNRFLMIPGAGAIGNALIHVAPLLGFNTIGGLPMSVQGDMQSLKTVFPEAQMPGVSPIVSMAAQELAKFNPALERQLTALVGSRAMTGDALDWFIPSSPIRNIVRGLRADEADRSFQNAMLTSIAAAYYHGQMPDANASASERQAAIDRIKNNARSIFMAKALLGMASPLAPQVSQSDFTAAGDSFTEEFQKMIKANKGDYTKALNQFIAEHGSKSISYTVAKSRETDGVQGTYMPYTNKAINWIQDNQPLITSALQSGAAFLIPQSDGQGNAQAIHDEMIALHLRERRTPEQFLEAIHIAAGNNLVYPASVQHQQLLKQYSDQGDTASAAAERQRWAQFTTQFGIANPLWYNDYQSSDRTHFATIALNDLGQIFANPEKMGQNFETEQTAAVRGIYNQYVNYKQSLLDAQNNGTGSTTDIKTAWKSYLLAQERDPALAPVVRSVFMRLANANG